MFFLTVVLAIVQYASLFSGSHAQMTDAECTSEFAWMSNSRGQSPCLVVAYLYVPCDGPTDAFTPRLTSSDSYYLGPRSQTECGCNTVMYSMLEACARCQYPLDVSLNQITWSQYAENCTSTSISSYPNPIPSGTAIPAWAFIDITVSRSPLPALLLHSYPPSSLHRL
ncbi:hypothetical protein C8Q76DRAFT_398599 [Earliella scabrosa]|nr:hypothetical protein C8Q76DRAFT_398599 [Earliella scabrosa]